MWAYPWNIIKNYKNRHRYVYVHTLTPIVKDKTHVCYTDIWYTCIIESTNARCLATCQSKKRGEGRGSRHTLGIFFGCLYIYVPTYVHIYICIDACAIHNVTYYLSNNYYTGMESACIYAIRANSSEMCIYTYMYTYMQCL